VAEIRCPKCGSRMVIPTTAEDDLRHYVCSNRPTCTGRIAVEDAWAYMWEGGRPTGPGAAGLQQSKKSSQSRAGTAVRILEEGGLWLSSISKRSKRKDKAPVHEVRGQDSDGKTHGQKLPSYLPQRTETQKKQADSREPERMKTRDVTHDKPEQSGALEKEAAIERKEPSKPRPKASPERARVPKKKTEIHKGKKPSRYWWQRAAKKETAPEVKEPHKPKQPGALSDGSPLKKEEPPSPQPRIALKPEIAPEVEELPKPRHRPLSTLRKELSTNVKRLFRHWRRRAPERESAPDKPVEPMATEVYEPDRAKESLSPQPLEVTQSDMDARKRKHTLIIIIIAMVVACMVAIACVIYAVLVLM
jgi:ssDNA-binding Zn-finger/Zn-ribbon topoisomerase 1